MIQRTNLHFARLNLFGEDSLKKLDKTHIAWTKLRVLQKVSRLAIGGKLPEQTAATHGTRRIVVECSDQTRPTESMAAQCRCRLTQEREAKFTLNIVFLGFELVNISKSLPCILARCYRHADSKGRVLFNLCHDCFDALPWKENNIAPQLHQPALGNAIVLASGTIAASVLDILLNQSSAPRERSKCKDELLQTLQRSATPEVRLVPSRRKHRAHRCRFKRLLEISLIQLGLSHVAVQHRVVGRESDCFPV
mmetsp:Transcript_3866/g.6187  ORF Transcript_3866/g.6187 Transcript_3866/m.6187 type:complete len:251 (-) Transcript_3866:1240-1992(-)